MTLIDDIIRREGGFVNHPADRGGPTKYGITLATLSHWRQRPVTIDDVRNLSYQEAFDIYHARYVVEPGFTKIECLRLREQLCDAAVHHGPPAAVRLLQGVVGTKQDGVLGPITLAAVSRADRTWLPARFLAARIRLFAGILERDRSQRVFAAGWFNRCAEMLDRAAR